MPNLYRTLYSDHIEHKLPKRAFIALAILLAGFLPVGMARAAELNTVRVRIPLNSLICEKTKPTKGGDDIPGFSPPFEGLSCTQISAWKWRTLVYPPSSPLGKGGNSGSPPCQGGVRGGKNDFGTSQVTCGAVAFEGGVGGSPTIIRADPNSIAAEFPIQTKSPPVREKSGLILPKPVAAHGWGSFYRFHQSRAHHHNGVTYLTWPGKENHPYVAAYDHAARRWSEPIQVGVNRIAPNDYHGNPSILVDRAGYIHVFYGGHNQHMRYSRSRFPANIMVWDDFTERLPYTDSTYPQLFEMGDGTIYAFYRRQSHRGHWTYVTSANHGVSWSEEHFVLNGVSPPGRGWYAAFAKDPVVDRIHVVFLWHADYDTQPNSRRNLYYAYMDHRTRQWRAMDGAPLSTPLSFEDANAQTLFLDTHGRFSSYPQVMITPDSRPMAINNLADEVGMRSRWLHVWTGDAWRSNPVPVDAILQPRSNRLAGYSNENGRVQQYTSDDQGLTWEADDVLIEAGEKVILNTNIANAHPDAQLVIVDSYRVRRPGTQRIWMAGDSGFLE
ncbi:MAG: BNR-4 repeat-containing protein [Leptolyngbyaceae cyanobacterium MO_188.B28]|nr:BNR-4 repeat-containing protein [Leptolyngbyaceae cyanobacterium MO_188.B28]